LITSEQVRAARALLKWTAEYLSNSAGVGHATVKRIEAGFGVPSTHARTLEAIQNILEKNGVEFIGTPDNCPGVRLRQKKE
jgi:transcriptional regulator with XRE-family HTH domain